MKSLRRVYDGMLDQHLKSLRQMAFVAGPRQVGKTTTCRTLASSAEAYFSFDLDEDRRLIQLGPAAVAERIGLSELAETPRTIVFDELHKYSRWRAFLKGFFDTYSPRARVVVTGSSRLDVYRRGGDSLMGRYFLYRMHPLTVGELAGARAFERETVAPRTIRNSDWQALYTYGGFPEPFLKRNARFHRRWRDLRLQQLIREDVRDLTRIQEVRQLESFVMRLAERSAQPLVYSTLAREIHVTVDTIRRWVDVLATFHYGFLVRPWHKNVLKSLRKEPKWYATDWSAIEDPGQRAETIVACHLVKAVDAWTDLGLGRYELRYLRDKAKREVDFLIVRDRKPWFLVEAKLADRSLSPSLGYFQQQVGASHAFQAVVDMDFVKADCFSRTDPCVVPARTLLSQLV
ncbi:MAG: ATP-binding protein [Planctomycetes bacterium]|nr:ATP-binding protein [Planctomycetota bacterium]